MPLFKRRPKPVPGPPINLRPAAAPPTEPVVDWSDDELIRAEWTRFKDAYDAEPGWRNGMALFDENPHPMQRVNVAEYMCRGLALTYLGRPLIAEDLAAESVRRVLVMIEAVPPEAPEWMRNQAPTYSRLALAIIRQKKWQPTELGGDGTITTEIQSASPNGTVWNSVSSPEAARPDYMRHFFSRPV